MWLLMGSISIGANSVYLNSVIYNRPMVLHFTLFFYMATRRQIKVKGTTVNSESRQIKAAKHTKCV